MFIPSPLLWFSHTTATSLPIPAHQQKHTTTPTLLFPFGERERGGVGVDTIEPHSKLSKMGRQIGSWKLKESLGKGCFGEVKFAVNTENGQQAAAKICAKQSVAKGQGRTLLQREIATMKQLNHPNVLKLYEVLETSRHYYLVLELASGGELFDLIQENKRFGDSTARKYFQKLMMGIKYCHEQGIVHRDLKPQNLLLTASDELKLAGIYLIFIFVTKRQPIFVFQRDNVYTQVWCQHPR